MDETNNPVIAHSETPQTLDYASPSTDPRRPFPWKRIFEWMIALGIILFIAAMLLPAIGGSRPAYRAQCGANLHQIDVTLIMCARDNGGRFPDSLEAAILTPYTMSPQTWAKVLVCPQSIDTPAPGTTAQQVAANLHALGRPMQFLNTKNPPPLHVSYIYLGKGLTYTYPVSSRKVLVFEPPEHHVIGKDSSINTAWTDGSVHTYTLDAPTMQKLMTEFQAGQNPPATLKKIEGLP